MPLGFADSCSEVKIIRDRLALGYMIISAMENTEYLTEVIKFSIIMFSAGREISSE